MRFEVSQKAKLPTKYGTFWIQSFREYVEDLGLGAARDLQNLEGAQDLEGGGTHAAQIPLASPREHLVVFTQHLGKIPLVRLHSECLTGDVFGSLKCDCGEELAHSMRAIHSHKEGGMLLYLRQEGRGIGLFNKVNAYALQDKGRDTIEANLELDLPGDYRNYEIVSAIFQSFGIREIELLTNNPLKVDSLAQYAKVSRQSIIVGCNEHNKQYLEIKKHKMGHLL